MALPDGLTTKSNTTTADTMIDETKYKLAEQVAKQRQHIWNLMQSIKYLLHAGTSGYPDQQFAQKAAKKWLAEAEAFDEGKEAKL
jgi:hypothetical protein